MFINQVAYNINQSLDHGVPIPKAKLLRPLESFKDWLESQEVYSLKQFGNCLEHEYKSVVLRE